MFDTINNVKIITIEGADGTGKDTVAQELHRRLESSLLVSFPYRYNVTGRLINDILQKKKPMVDPLAFQSLMLVNKIETLKDICDTIEFSYLEKPTYIIFARYYYSGIIYGLLDEIPAILSHSINQVLPQSQNIFILHGKIYKDFKHESEYYETVEKQKQVTTLYLKCAQEFGWNIINNDKPVTAIVSDILTSLGEQT